MDSKNLGRSLPVPNVQELAKDPSLKQVPPRYVRPNQDQPIYITDFDNQLPVIDFSKLLSTDSASELLRFHNACREWGFFQLINHGVSGELMENMKRDVQEFFKLPMEEKMKYKQKDGDIEGLGQAFVVSEEQKLDWADMLYIVTLPTHLRKPHLLPSLPLPLRETMDAYSREMKNLAMQILNVMAKALKMESNEMNELFEEGTQGIRINYYPPCPQPELVTGLNPHSDGVGLTILLQLNEVEGLQVRNQGKWIPVTPLPGAFIINIGDMLEIVTNGIYRSIEHRASVNSSKERLSMATFYSPNIEGVLGPARSLITPQTPALFKTIGVPDFFKGYFARELRGKSYLDVLRIQNGSN